MLPNDARKDFSESTSCSVYERINDESVGYDDGASMGCVRDDRISAMVLGDGDARIRTYMPAPPPPS